MTFFNILRKGNSHSPFSSYPGERTMDRPGSTMVLRLKNKRLRKQKRSINYIEMKDSKKNLDAC